MNQYRFKRSFYEDPTIRQRLFNLLDIVYTDIEISRVAETARILGASWEGASTPFISLHEDVAIAHVGVLEIPM